MFNTDDRYIDILRAANALLARSERDPGGVVPLGRLRLARDILSTKVLKLAATSESERQAAQELDEAADQLAQEIQAIRRVYES